MSKVDLAVRRDAIFGHEHRAPASQLLHPVQYPPIEVELVADLTAGIVAWHDHPPFDAKVAPQDLARYPWIDLDWPAALGSWLAWLSVELLGRLPSGLIRPLPVDIGRFRYRRSGFVARRSAEELPPFRAPEQAVRDTALSLKRRSRNLRPARNPNVYASFVAIGDPIRRGPAQSGAFPRFFAPSAETGPGVRHRSESGRIQTPDHGWLLMTSSSDFGASRRPTGASWLNQVERFFALLTEKQLRRGVHRSTRELEQAIRHYIDTVNTDPRPFRWTKSADDILATIKRFCLRTLDTAERQTEIIRTSESGH